MTDHTDDEVSFLDLVLVAAENWIVLILLPLFVGVVTYGVSISQPRMYLSEVTIALPVPAVLEAVKIGIEKGTLDPVLTPSNSGSAGLTVTEGNNIQSSQLTLIHTDRDDISAFSQFVSDLESGPLAYSREHRAARIGRLENTLALRNTIITRIETALADFAEEDLFDAEAYSASALALDQMIAGRALEEVELESLKTELVAAANSSIVTPLLSGPHTERRAPLMLAALAALGSGLVLLVLVFIRAGLKGAATEPETRAKLDRIKSAFLLRSPRPKDRPSKS